MWCTPFLTGNLKVKTLASLHAESLGTSETVLHSQGIYKVKLVICEDMGHALAIHNICAHVMNVHAQVHTYKVLTVQQAGPQQPEPAQNSPFCRSTSDGHCILPPCSITRVACSAVATEQAFKFFKGLKVSSDTQNGLAVEVPGSVTSKGPEASPFALGSSPKPEASAFASVASLEPEAPSPLASGWNNAFADGNLVSTIERVQGQCELTFVWPLCALLGSMIVVHQPYFSLACDRALRSKEYFAVNEERRCVHMEVSCSSAIATWHLHYTKHE